MTQDIIEMARDTANHGTHASGEVIYTFYSEQLEAFYKLATAKAFQSGYEKGIAAFNEAVLIEREACALICERIYKRMCPEAQENEVGIEAEIMRARGDA